MPSRTSTPIIRISLFFYPLPKQLALVVYQVEKVKRCILTLIQLEYAISHLRGELNYFLDLMSRWGDIPRRVRRLLRVPLPTVMSDDVTTKSFLPFIREGQDKMDDEILRALDFHLSAPYNFLQSFLWKVIRLTSSTVLPSKGSPKPQI